MSSNSKINKAKAKSFFSRHSGLVVTFFVVVLLMLSGLIYYVIDGLPSLSELENPKPQLASKVYTVDGELLGQFYIENRIETDYDSIPKHFIEALIATEDRKFFEHWGVDVDRFIKAMVKNVFTFSREGASTLTQQLAKNLYSLKGTKENSFDTAIRKIREWITAIQIERTYTKKEIIELYLNVSFLGKSAYGIETGAKTYFDKKAKDLSITESALLVALLKSHVFYDPVRRPENALRRRNLVLYNMIEPGYLTEEEYRKLKDEPILLAGGKIISMSSEAPHFMEYIRQQMSAMAEKYGYDLYRDGLNIYTTLDLKMQRIANKVASEHLKEYQQVFNKNWNWDRNQKIAAALVDKAIKSLPEYREGTPSERALLFEKLSRDKSFIDSVKTIEGTIQTGFVVSDPHNGEIRALVGGENQEFFYGLNHVTQIKRQPGSSFKPIIYAMAVDNGFYPAFALLNQKFDHNGWSPSNADAEYGGYMTLREALAKSVNVIAGRLTIGEYAPPDQVVRLARKMGITAEIPPYPSIALGTAEISPLEMNAAFGVFANDGIYVSPISILRIEDRNGMTIEEFKPEYREAMSQQTAGIIVNMMQDVLNYGTGGGVRRYFHRPAAGKTGTTQDFADAWFIGYTPQLVGCTWVGFDDRRVKFNGWYGQGAKAAMPIWAKFMAEYYKEFNPPLEYFKLPEGVESRQFCKESINNGDMRLATENCPSKVSDLVNVKKLPPTCIIHSNGRTIQTDRGSGW
jgi:penicillin-binding protein 1A